MQNREVLCLLSSAFLLPCALGIASLSLRDQPGAALAFYLAALALSALTAPPKVAFSSKMPLLHTWRIATERAFLLILVAAFSFLDACPPWFLGLLLSATLMQAAALLLVRPSRLSPPLVPELTVWNAQAQRVIPGVFLVDFLLISLFPQRFVLSPDFHLAGYAFLAVLQTLELANGIYRTRRTMAVWFRGLVLHGIETK
jgi:hypothetical protein